MIATISTSDFSSHLFWDVDVSSVDLDKNRAWMVRRILEKGTLDDWLLLKKCYSKDELRNAVSSLRSLEKKATSFACAVLDLDQTKLRCYTTRQSQNTPWNH